MLTLKEPTKPADVSIDEMRPGDIAVVTKSELASDVGDLVMRTGDKLIEFDDPNDEDPSNFFKRTAHGTRVRILGKGEELVVS